MTEHYEPTVATTVPDPPVITETAFVRAVRTAVRPFNSMHWRQVLVGAAILAAAMTLLVCSLEVGASPWSILRDGFCALERLLTG